MKQSQEQEPEKGKDWSTLSMSAVVLLHFCISYDSCRWLATKWTIITHYCEISSNPYYHHRNPWSMSFLPIPSINGTRYTTGTCIALHLVLKDCIFWWILKSNTKLNTKQYKAIQVPIIYRAPFMASNTSPLQHQIPAKKILRPFFFTVLLRCKFEWPTFAPLKRLNGWHGNDSSHRKIHGMGWSPMIFCEMNVGFIDFSIFEVCKM